ncbi:MAG: DNA polymerase III subunit delta [Pseudomonadota bacterium]
MKPAQFFARLEEGPLLPLYCFYGEERYLQDKAVQVLLKRGGEVIKRNVTFEVYSGPSTSLSSILDSARTLPFFGKRKMILLREPEKLLTSGRDLLLAYLKNPSRKTILIFTGEKINLQGEIREVFNQNGMVQEFKHPYPNSNDLYDWIEHMAKEHGKAIEVPAIHLMVELTGNHLQDLSNEMEKLCLFIGERRKITREDVEKVISSLKVESIFELTDYIGNRKLLEALKALSQLMESGEESRKILPMIVRHFRMLMKIRYLLDQKLQPEKIRSSLNIKDFLWKKLYPQTQKFPRAKLEHCFERLWEADLSLKTQHRIPAKIVLEHLITELSK